MNIEYVSFQENGYCSGVEKYCENHFSSRYSTDKFVLNLLITNTDEMVANKCLAAIKNLIETLQPNIVRVNINFIKNREFKKSIRFIFEEFCKNKYTILLDTSIQFSIRQIDFS